MSTSVRLPLEIVESIIDILAQDDDSHFSSIKECALVCHGFLHFCRKHIFASIALSSPMLFQKPRVLLFQKLLSTTPEIAPYVRQLFFGIRTEDCDNISLLETFKKITRIKTLSLHLPWCATPERQWNNLIIKPMLLHLMHLPTLTRLILTFIHNFSFTDLLSCANLRDMNMSNMKFDSNVDTSVADFPASLIRLSDLTVGSMSASGITDMCTLRRADGKLLFDFEYVKRLFVAIEHPEDIQTARLLFDHCRQLTSVGVELEVSSIPTNWTQIGVAAMLVPSLLTLKHLSFQFTVDENDPLADLSFELAAMDKNIVETIEIEITVSFYSTCTRGDEWDRLDTTLTRKSIWQNLTSVSLTIDVWTSSDHDGDDGLADAMLDMNETRFEKLFSGKFVEFSFKVRQGFD